METDMLPEEMMLEILSWLPPVVLLRFRSVSKPWLHTIGSSYFIAQHQSHFGSSLRIDDDNNGLIVITTDSSKLGPYGLLERRQAPRRKPRILEAYAFTGAASGSYKVKGTCNGLYCYGPALGDQQMIMLHNPSIRYDVVVPPYRCNEPGRVSISFTHGVGIDQFANDYKVVQLRSHIHDTRHLEAAVYSVRTTSWKTVKASLVPPIYVFGWTSFFRGFIHWLGMKGFIHRLDMETGNKVIIVFDVRNEVFGEMQLPEIENHRTVSISETKGSLCLVVALMGHKRADNTSYHVWIMKEYGVAESWTKLFTVVHQQTLTCIQVTVGGMFLGYVPSDEGSVRLVLYDPETGEWGNLRSVVSSFIDAMSLVQSLELLNFKPSTLISP